MSVAELFSFLLGLCLGSFLNVCIYRIPAGESIINPPSRCPFCKEHIRFYDNIPVLSYIILRGRCRSCGGKISIQYPVVEISEALFSYILFIKFGLSIEYIAYLAFISSLIVITFIDLRHMIIPDIISIPGIIAGIVSSIILPHIHIIDSIIGLVAGGGSFYLIALIFLNIKGKEGMGGGDIKLIAMIGAWMGWRPLPIVVLISSIMGIIIGGGALLVSGEGLKKRIPFGPFLSMGAIIYLLFKEPILSFLYRYPA